MIFTPAERRLLALLILFLGAGYLISALRHWGFLPAVEGGREPRAADEPAYSESAATWDVLPQQPDYSGVSIFRDGYLDLNRADSLALIALPGIGPALCGRILAAREGRGGFQSVDELLAVRGIGPKTLERLRDYVKIANRSDSAEPVSHEGVDH